MDVTIALQYSFLAILVYMHIMWLLALYAKDNGIVDIAWGMGFVLVAGLTLWLDGSYTTRQLLVSSMVLVWALRLSGHIHARNKGRGEDFRYKAWRKQWGKKVASKAYVKVFMLQGFIMWIVSAVIVYVNSTPLTGLSAVDIIGLLIWLVGFYFESVADWTILQHKRAGKKGFVKDGLFKYSRHPNYFGEAVMWWGIFIIAWSIGGGWTIISPLVITLLLRFVSGVPMLERKLKNNIAYQKYACKTNAFIPGRPLDLK